MLDVHFSRRMTTLETEELEKNGDNTLWRPEHFSRRVTIAQTGTTAIEGKEEPQALLPASPPSTSSGDSDPSQFGVYWKTFRGDHETHNQTVDGRPIPGSFLDDSLYLLGARLTTSYETHDQSVFVTLFGMPGDLWSRIKDNEKRCKKNHLMGANTSLLNYSDVIANITIYCQLECRHGLICGRPVHMKTVYAVSGESHLIRPTLIWHGNITKHITRNDLRQQPHNETAVRVRFWASTRSELHSKAWSLRQNLALVDIPLTTGVVGHAGPQVRSAPQFSEPIHASLCVSISEQKELPYLPEFIQHHKNIGFESIIVGLNTFMGSGMMYKAKRLLEKYIAEGTVDLAATGIREFACDIDVVKDHFYSSCLYHSKGYAEFMGTWHVDEFWLPPINSEFWLPPSDLQGLKFPSRNTDTKRPEILTNDKLWNGSMYSVFPDIQDVTKSIQEYHESHGCGDRWCFHGFPSVDVFLNQSSSDKKEEASNDQSSHKTENSSFADRSPYIINRFAKRENRFNTRHSKSILRTKYTFMGGTRQPGSCRYDNAINFRNYHWVDRYYDVNTTGHCRNLRRNHNGSIAAPFGAMHHFGSLISRREERVNDYDESLPVDEYVRLYGKTVAQQLKAIYKNKKAVK